MSETARKRSDPAERVFVGLGSNLGDRAHYLAEAVRALAGHPEIEVVRVSPVYKTKAHTLEAGEGQPDYLNAVAELRTRLEPEALLRCCQRLEKEAGRERLRRWAPRTLDLDVLLYGARQCRSTLLQVPHPRLAERRFVLRPLADLAPNLQVPAPFNATVADLLERCPDKDTIVPGGPLPVEPSNLT